jgi:hypothetical protein
MRLYTAMLATLHWGAVRGVQRVDHRDQIDTVLGAWLYGYPPTK